MSGKRLRPSWTERVMLAGLLVTLAGCASVYDSFTFISQPGFDPEDNARDFNDYPWGMAWFGPDGSEEAGYLYVSTGNSVMNIAVDYIGIKLPLDTVCRPPEIRRYRPDWGIMSWERVFDFREIESEPNCETSGIRSMAVYTPQADQAGYLYAGTFSLRPSLWRSASGDPGTWERVFTNDHEGSIRALAAHNGLLYIGVAHESGELAPGELYATDGRDFWLVNNDGFGNSENTGVFSLASYNGWLYAGTNNRFQGYEVWKLEGPDGQNEPVRVITGGGPSAANQATTQMVEFKGHLYVGALVFGGLNISDGFLIRGADMVRIGADDKWETVVGPGSVGGERSGFGERTNAYLWSLTVYQDELYCGTWDSTSLLTMVSVYWEDFKNTLGFKAAQDPPACLIRKGAGLYKSSDGVHWNTVFNDGMGDPDNYGIRNMISIGDTLYIGLANVIEGLTIVNYTCPATSQ